MSDVPPSLPAPPAGHTRDFGGFLVPPAVQGRVINLLIDEAPFAASLTRLPTSSNTVVFPMASPEGAGWIGELDRIPLMSLNDQAVTVAVAKLAGLLDLSNEMISDSSLNVTSTFTGLLRDSLSPQLDSGLLYGSGPPEPAGVVAAAPPVVASDLLSATATAVGEISDAGGTPDTIAATGSVFSAEMVRTATDGHLMYASGFEQTVGLRGVAVPSLGRDVLIFDSRRLFLILNGALSSVELSGDFRFDFDATTMRVRSRVAVAAPAPLKSLRRWQVPGGGEDTEAQRTRATTGGQTTRK